MMVVARGTFFVARGTFFVARGRFSLHGGHFSEARAFDEAAPNTTLSIHFKPSH